jgi:quinol monooxygenase YgiN
MKSFQKKIFHLSMTSLAVILFACNGTTEKTEEAAKMPDTSLIRIAAPPAAPALAAPFDIMEINHAVKEYGSWKKAFDLDSTARASSGLSTLVLARSLDNPNDVSVTLLVSAVPKAKAFAAEPRLKDVMEKNGVVSKPDIGYYHVTRFNPDSKEKQWVLITHKVKDYAAWLKVYDAEGPATRASHGMIDVVLSRAIDDSNTVQIIFDIKDMAKAKARISSPELKKLMTDAGVTGAPKIEFYQQAE